MSKWLATARSKWRQLLLAFMIAWVQLCPMLRDVRYQMWSALIVVCVITMIQDRWLLALGLTTWISSATHWSATSASQMTSLAIFLLILDRSKGWDVTPILKFTVWLTTVAWIWSLFLEFRHPGMCGVLDNSVFKGPTLAIVSTLAYPVSPALAIVLAMGVVMAKSTTGILCLAAGYASWVTRDISRRSKWIAYLSMAGIMAVYVSMVDTYHAFSARLIMLGDLIDLGRKSFFGHGLGSFRAIFPVLEGRVLGGKLWAQAHCEPLQLWFEAGVLPALVVLAFVLWHCFRKADHVRYHGAMTAFIIWALLGFPFHHPAASLLFVPVWMAYQITEDGHGQTA